MALQVVQGKRKGILGNLGTLATLGGMLIPGAQWLTPLGMGMNAIDGMINGSGADDNTVDVLGKLKETMEGWKNPASGNIAKVANKAKDVAAGTASPLIDYDELRSRGWRPYM